MISTHPHEKIAEFVNKYNEKIKPLFEKGEEYVQKLSEKNSDERIEFGCNIIDICQEFYLPKDDIQIFEENLGADGEALQHYNLANKMLVNWTIKGINKENLKWAKERISENVSQLDKILANDSHYQKIRKKSQ